ncbi:MAG: prepilin-type N-terminal cleavage/methylation domain-containing protein [Phycisphaerae bacterium]|nr:prepilin-type N-terminal cleavage/methylation domain-containing protein [Phycisphaerae bacterium]
MSFREPQPGRRRKRKKRGQEPFSRAFTLIELLVVIAIISLLVSILVPSLTKAKELARQVLCQTNMKQMGMAFEFYLEDNERILPTGYDALTGMPWCKRLGENVWNDSGKTIFVCPSDISPREDIRLSYRANYWWMKWSNVNPPIIEEYKRIKNPSEKLAILEGSFRGTVLSGGVWSGNEQVVMHQGMAVEPPEKDGIDNRHNEGANYLWFDWHVSWETPYPLEEEYWCWE